jgi:predicted nuclease of predicted toxin-antitoxin system
MSFDRRMRFMLDENVANSVSEFLRAGGFEVKYIRALVPTGSVDPLVAFVAEDHHAILVSHDGDFQKIAPRIPDGQRRRFRELSRISLRCSEFQAAARLAKALSLIEAEFQIAQDSRDKRMHLTIGESYFRTDR